MTTLTQLCYNSKRSCKKNFISALKLRGNSQLKGIISRLAIMTPKKPNSALRHIAKLLFYKNKLRVKARIIGKGFLPSKFNRALVRGGRANDLPGVRYTLVRGVFDISPLFGKKERRSIYGVHRPEGFTTHVRRCYRKLGYA